MKLTYYEFDEEKLVREARKGKKVALKLPEGFMPHAESILHFLHQHGMDVTLLAESCYGACDFVAHDGIDRILCIGEAEMPYLRKIYRPPVSFIEVRYEFDERLLEKVLPHLSEKKVGLAGIAPFIHAISKCKIFLEERGYEVFIGKRSRRGAYDGQVLGCDFSPASSIAHLVDTFLFIGDGTFHPIGLHMVTGKPVVIFNPLERSVGGSDIPALADRIMRQRYAAIARAGDAERFGILVTEKIGQRRMQLAKKLKREVEKKGKRAYLIMVNNITEAVDYLDFDCFVSTACPRVAIDDTLRYKKPVLTPVELEILLGEREWTQYVFDQIF